MGRPGVYTLFVFIAWSYGAPILVANYGAGGGNTVSSKGDVLSSHIGITDINGDKITLSHCCFFNHKSGASHSALAQEKIVKSMGWWEANKYR